RCGRPARHRNDCTSLTRIAAGFVLVAVVLHEIQPGGMPRLQPQVGNVPENFGAVALVLWGGRAKRISTWSKVPVIPRWIGIGRNGNRGRGGDLIDYPDGGLPCPGYETWRVGSTPILPIPRKIQR